MTGLTTHVLDTTAGKPAAGLVIELWRQQSGSWQHLKTITTNADGRAPQPLLDKQSLECALYELRFHAGDYLRGGGVSVTEPAFLDVIPIRFGVADKTSDYHVPLLLSAFGYTTYRGS